MKKPIRHYAKYAVIGILILTVLMLKPEFLKRQKSSMRDYDAISEEGILRVAMEYGYNTYHFDTEGKPTGFHYDLIKQFADKHNLELEIIPETKIERQNDLLVSGACDLIAGDRLITQQENDSLFSYTLPVSIDRQIVMQRKSGTDTLCTHLNSLLDLAGKELCIPADSPFKIRILHLIEEIGDTIFIKEIPHYGSEQLMALVAHGDICYAVCKKEAVDAHIHAYPQLDNSLNISFNQFYGWMVRAKSTALLDSLNSWLQRERVSIR